LEAVLADIASLYFSVARRSAKLRVVDRYGGGDFDAPHWRRDESVEPRSVRLTLRGSYYEVNRLDGSQMSCVVRPG
jgi:hypothetical protein